MDPGRNACNVTVRYNDAAFEACLFLRNPAFLTPPDLLRIKREAVGVVEAAGEGIYPPPQDDQIDTLVRELQRDGLRIIKTDTRRTRSRAP